MRKGEYVKIKVNYPKNPKLNGIYTGKVIQVGCYYSGFAYFKLDSNPNKALPNSSRYTEIIERIKKWKKILRFLDIKWAWTF